MKKIQRTKIKHNNQKHNTRKELSRMLTLVTSDMTSNKNTKNIIKLVHTLSNTVDFLEERISELEHRIDTILL